MKVLITGGTGFIGSHTVVSLQEQGFEVVIVDNLSNSDSAVLNRIAKITGKESYFYCEDICNRDALKNIFSEHQDIVAVIHFAAFKAVGESVEQPLKYYHNNITGLVSLLEEMKSARIPNIIFSSSATVYGQPENLPATEDSPVLPATSPYGNTKQINEQILRDFLLVNQDLKGISLRYFNPIGAHPGGLIGELPIGTPNNLMPFITQTAIGKHAELKVFGNDYNTPDGTAIRDYIHVVDLAEAHVVAMNALLNNSLKENYSVFNLGTGNGFSVLEVIQSFEKTTGVKLPYRIVERRPGDVEQIYASTKLANEVLGWKAKYSLDDMTLSAWDLEKRLSEQHFSYDDKV
ncbi:MAG TPA: UDP-glucose 4-epimerase GalE [Saprospirales bacterium]|nr:UDP-glucose 4-epimerase GalE [Saprospirales bacterium]